MILHQRFIELGEGFGDIFELCELISTNSNRLHKTFILSSVTPAGLALSFAAAFEPANDSNFMPIYICREGILQQGSDKSKRRMLFEETAEKTGSIPVYIELKNSSEFAERDLFYHYVTGILRLNHLLPPLR
ncbi:DUF7147 family protein [Sporosarcina limicola]|uniref:DUF7147 domain-containing protein n=1 Tax=Sporosarcina limicola TaxID=34101 RepID=A0A927MF44_9BACL|nr:methylthioribose kinase [Sporosarcina limicola]MBE1553579.1 hypothetical protein [Sporosarcina limicola]